MKKRLLGTLAISTLLLGYCHTGQRQILHNFKVTEAYGQEIEESSSQDNLGAASSIIKRYRQGSELEQAGSLEDHIGTYLVTIDEGGVIVAWVFDKNIDVMVVSYSDETGYFLTNYGGELEHLIDNIYQIAPYTNWISSSYYDINDPYWSYFSSVFDQLNTAYQEFTKEEQEFADYYINQVYSLIEDELTISYKAEDVAAWVDYFAGQRSHPAISNALESLSGQIDYYEADQPIAHLANNIIGGLVEFNDHELTLSQLLEGEEITSLFTVEKLSDESAEVESLLE